MVELPFQQPQTLNQRQNKALALAAVFQATQLTHMTAISGRQSIGESGNFYFEQLIKASLNIRPSENQSSQTLDFFHQLSDISLGLKTLESSITQPFTPTPKSKIPKLSSAKLPMSYAMSLLALEKKVYSNPKFVEIIENAGEPSARITGFITFTIIYTGINIRIIVKYSFAKPIVTSDAPNKYNSLSININPNIRNIILMTKLTKILFPIALSDCIISRELFKLSSAPITLKFLRALYLKDLQ